MRTRYLHLIIRFWSAQRHGFEHFVTIWHLGRNMRSRLTSLIRRTFYNRTICILKIWTNDSRISNEEILLGIYCTSFIKHFYYPRTYKSENTHLMSIDKTNKKKPKRMKKGEGGGERVDFFLCIFFLKIKLIRPTSTPKMKRYYI